jgi:hypothetical protein
VKEYFYDIESLSNVFTLCNFRQDENAVDVFALVDDRNLIASPEFIKELATRIYDKNQNFNGTVRFYDLSTIQGATELARLIGVSNAYITNNPSNISDYDPSFRPVCDTDPNYDENVHPYLFGYNSYNYDTTMLAQYFDNTWVRHSERLNPHSKEPPQYSTKVTFQPVTAKELRQFNNLLFTERFKKQMPQALTYELITVPTESGNMEFFPSNEQSYQDNRWKLRKSMLMTGRHIDVARLNEKQSKVGLKRLLGMLGHQILESDKLGTGVDRIATSDQFYDLVAYNVSDCVNLAELFHHPFYQGQFALKKGLLNTYPELIYEQRTDAYAPDIRPEKVRRDRLTIDSSSAQFATKALCPYGHLTDLPTVSYVYPSDRKVAELKAQGKNVHQVNVLEESKKFFYAKFKQPKLRAEFDKIYNYYKEIEGKNFNASKNYVEDYGHDGRLPMSLEPQKLSYIHKCPNNMFYYNADGTPSTCFITFSTGGIHGAEYNKARYEADMKEYRKAKADMNYVQKAFPDPLTLRKAKTVTTPDGTEHKYTDFIKSGATAKKMEATPVNERHTFYRTIQAPVLFKPQDDGSTKINPKYVFTSAAITNHEDFTSYYPNMLRMMSAFWNAGLGTDRYGEIFDNKQKYGKLMKDKSLSTEERNFYSVLREGTKLILNSASGAGDTDFESPIQMNNRIISMRIIGQLFTWRIGQAQTLHGASIISTNTDGLFSVMEEEENNRILASESAEIGVEIEPEITYLISKDSNNRTEIDPVTGEVQAASGGTLACRKDTTPVKALAHPAIIDWALTEYLIVAANGYKGLALDKPFDRSIGESILRSSKKAFPDKAHRLRMYQNVLASSPGSINYIFATRDDVSEPVILQHYNRVFIMKDGTKNTLHLHAANAKKITPATAKRRIRDHMRSQIHDPTALFVLAANGVTLSDIPSDCDAVVKKVTNIEPEWSMRVENHSINLMEDAVQQEILDDLDYDKYLDLLQNAYTDNWMNVDAAT